MEENINNIPQPSVPVDPQPLIPINPQVNLDPHPQLKPIMILIILGVLIAGYFASAKYAFHTWPFKVSVVTTPSPILTPSPSPTPDETATWQTYRNDQYGFEVKYPWGWLVKSAEAPSKDISRLSALYFSPAVEEFPPLGVTAHVSTEKVNEELKKIAKKLDNILINNQNWTAFYFYDDTIESGPYSKAASLVKNGVTYYFVTTTDSNYSNKIFDQILSTFKFIDNARYSYELRQLSKDFGSDAFYDAKLVQINQATKEENVLVPSIKQAVPELQKEFNLTLVELSYPTNSERLYFREILSETDAPVSAIYAFDLQQKKFIKLAVSSHYAGFGVSVLSPDGKRVVSTIDPKDDGKTQKLFILDLEKDTVRTVLILQGNETLNYCVSDCFGGNAGEVEWIDDKMVQYSVYDASKTTKNQNETTVHPLIERRILSVPQ